MKKLTELSNEVLRIFPELKENDIGKFEKLRYPRFLPMMRMRVKSLAFPGFGSVMTMDTSMMGFMKLTTVSFTPSSGISVPFLLIDSMVMGKKRLAYVEFYDCRARKDPIPELEDLDARHKELIDYAESPAWYVGERMKGSLIKCGTPREEEALAEMISDALAAYRKCIEANTTKMPDNLEGLRAFRKRMIEEGNPSSATLDKVLGQEEAVNFFKTIVMPVPEKD